MALNWVLALGAIGILAAALTYQPYTPHARVVDYDLRLDLDTSRSIRGAATLTMQTGGAERSVRLDLLDMTVDSVRVDGRSAPFQRTPTQIEITLPANERRPKVAVSYHGTPSDGLIIGRDSAGRWMAFGDNWPTRARHWFPSVDDPSDKATVTWTVRAPAAETVVANGIQVYEKPLKDASGAAMVETQWRESHPIAPYLMVVAVAPLVKYGLGCARVGEQCVPQFVYAAPEQRAMLPGPFARATDMVAFYTRLIGPFPYEKLAHLQSSTRYGGMENASAIFYADRPFRGTAARFAAFATTVAHETAHQWFGDAVTEREWSHVWLSEGFATYFAALWEREANGEAAFRAAMQRMRQTVLADTVSVPKRPVIDTAQTSLMALLNRNSYEKGGFVLHMLHGQVGDSAFFAALRRYYAAHRDSTALTGDLQAEMERASGQQLGWFFEQWLRRPGYPTVTAEWSYDPGARAVAIQAWEDRRFGGYRVPVVVEATDSSGAKQRIRLELNAAAGDSARGRIALGTAPRDVTIDPDVSLLAVFAVRQRGTRLDSASLPPPPPQRELGLVGEYDTPAGMRVVLEDAGALYAADTNQHRIGLAERGVSDDYEIVADAGLLGVSGAVRFVRDPTGRATEMLVGDTRLPRRNIEPAPGTNQLHVTPLRPLSELRTEALAATPPTEQGPFRSVDLVELTRLDSTIHLEIRYATTNNFLGARFYDQARAFMERPAADAVVRANRALRPLGYGLLIHDAYRPWFVTKMFWDATPPDKRWLVADPSQGSRHNRGAAVDLTMYELATGRPVEMPSTYDESTDRAFADYPGGTSRQRWYRALLRRAMEAEGFTVNPSEWWHFDYQDWRAYPIVNVPFDRLGG